MHKSEKYVVITQSRYTEKRSKMDLLKVADYEKVFKKKTVEAYYEYFRRGASDEVSLRLNTTAYNE